MVRDLWNEIDLPVLEVIADHDAEHGPVQNHEEVAKLAGREVAPVVASLGRLADGEHIEAATAQGMGSTGYFHIVPTATGRRAVGQWPSHDAAEALLLAVERQVALSTDSEERTRWSKLAEQLRAVGTGVVSGLLVEATKQAGGF